MVTRRTTALVALVLGPKRARPLLAAHVVGVIASGWVTVALAKSLFFGLSADASRHQVLLYLLVTLLPVAALSRFVGPTVDFVRGGAWRTAHLANVARAVCAIGLALSLDTPTFFVWAFALLVANKFFSTSKYALLPMLTNETSGLVTMNVRFSKWGSAAGAVAVSTGVLLNQQLSPRWALVAAAGVFWVASRLRPTVLHLERIVDEAQPEPHYEATRSHRASIPFIAIRCSAGLFAFAAAFALRQEDGSLHATLVIVGASYAAGSFLGNLLAPVARRHWTEERMMEMAILPAALACATAAVLSSPVMFGIASLMFGFATAHTRQAFDSIVQSERSDSLRGRRYAHFETLAQVGWVLGSAGATLLTPQLQYVWILVAIAAVVSVHRVRGCSTHHVADDGLTSAAA